MYVYTLHVKCVFVGQVAGQQLYFKRAQSSVIFSHKILSFFQQFVFSPALKLTKFLMLF